MTRDLKHRVPGIRTKKKTGTPGWLVALFVATALGLVANSGFRAWKNYAEESNSVHPTPTAVQFSFYDTVSEHERILDEKEIKDQGKQSGTGIFFIQVGAFAQQDDAKNLLTRLEGITQTKPRLEAIERNGNIWYRVRLGPYKTLTDAGTIRQFLREHQIDSIIQTLAQ